MANLSQMKREKMLAFLETLKEQHSDDESLLAIGQIEKELKGKKYGLVWEEHSDEWYLTLLFPLYGGGKGWFNVPDGYVDCAARDKNMDKYNDNEDAQERWKNYKERMQ